MIITHKVKSKAYSRRKRNGKFFPVLSSLSTTHLSILEDLGEKSEKLPGKNILIKNKKLINNKKNFNSY